MLTLKITLISIPYNQMREKSGLTSSILARHTILVGMISFEKGIVKPTTIKIKRTRIESLKKTIDGTRISQKNFLELGYDQLDFLWRKTNETYIERTLRS